ncbi:MAG: DUF1588 domain-containing protein [Rubripirellula sp.]|nr:DUF1588 domain-containing protein [Rubripirellula sp.]
MIWKQSSTIPFLIVLAICTNTGRSWSSEINGGLQQLLSEHCFVCHGAEDVNGEVNFEELSSYEDWIRHPALIEQALEAISSAAMPPEGEPAPSDESRLVATNALKKMLKEASLKADVARQPLRRLNRLQYNNTVRDIFQLNRDIFPLSEKLMTRYDDYLSLGSGDVAVRMPKTVHVASHTLQPTPGLTGVKPYPKDLRASHGFDNQADQLTLSPLLLDAFLQFSVSILESEDFNQSTVGVWDEFFSAPGSDADSDAAIRDRLQRFLRLAFRGNVNQETVERYAVFTKGKLNSGLSFTEAMKKAAAVAMSSPLFLYRATTTDQQGQEFALASRLSYFLWASCPDDELLELAEQGQLSDPDVLQRTLDRMMRDQKIERFLDTFPAQWMQLENLMAATPDPAINKYFHLDPKSPASLQMVLEPLLLFDTVFVENRPITDLISPTFGYQSEFLQTWYNSKLEPPDVDRNAILATNQMRDEQRLKLQVAFEQSQQQLSELVDPVRERLLKAKSEGDAAVASIDLKPYAAWDFDGDLTDSMNRLPLKAHGKISFENGLVLLNKAYLQSEPLQMELKAKSLEVQFRLKNLDQRGGGLMGIQGPGDFFDTIVIGERQNRHWISGSNGFSRTEDFPESFEETVQDQLVHLLMVYEEDGTTALYRNGKPYGKPYKSRAATFPKNQTSVLFGLRHLPAGGNRFLAVNIDRARFYDRALTVDEIEAAVAASGNFISTAELLANLNDQQRERREELLESLERTRQDLAAVPPNIDLTKAVDQVRREYEQDLKRQLKSREFRFVELSDHRYGGIITNAAMLSMTSGQKRTHPVARGVWVIEVILNDPPNPPPNDVPALDEENADKNLTIREQFAAHRENASCAGCHNRLDPLGFALENYDITGRWRDRYQNGREVDVAGTLLRKHDFRDVLEFKESLMRENRVFIRAFAKHLLRFAVARELRPGESLTIDEIVEKSGDEHFKLRALMREVVLSSSFRR